MPIVDAHPHIYSPDRQTYPTIQEPWEPGEPASAEDLKLKMDAVGVDRAIFIQTSTFYGHDNRYIIESSKQHADWACGVVTLDPDDASHIDLLEDAVENSNIRGMRGTTDAINRISSPNVYRLWRKAMDLGIVVNCMVMDDLDRVPEIERIAGDLGDLRIVIDHCFMLNTRSKTEETLAALERLARQPNVYAKLTPGTHGSYRVYPFVDMHGPLRRVIDAFGPERCVWGSNFPNALWSKGASYAQNLHLFVKELGLSLPEKAHVLGTTAISLWFPEEFARQEQVARDQKKRTEREAVRAREETVVAKHDEEEEVDEEPSEEDARSARVANIADIITGKAADADVDDEMEVEVSAIMDVADELNSVLGIPEDEESPGKSQAPEPEPEPVEAQVEANEPEAAQAEPEAAEDDADGDLEMIGPGDEVLNVAELLAAQNFSPGKEDDDAPGRTSGGIGHDEADDEMDLSSIMDVANRLNEMLEPADETDAHIVDLSDDLEADDDEDDRSSA